MKNGATLRCFGSWETLYFLLGSLTAAVCWPKQAGLGHLLHLPPRSSWNSCSAALPAALVKIEWFYFPWQLDCLNLLCCQWACMSPFVGRWLGKSNLCGWRKRQKLYKACGWCNVGQTPAERGVRDVMLILCAIVGFFFLDAVPIVQSWEEEMPNF